MTYCVAIGFTRVYFKVSAIVSPNSRSAAGDQEIASTLTEILKYTHRKGVKNLKSLRKSKGLKPLGKNTERCLLIFHAVPHYLSKNEIDLYS